MATSTWRERFAEKFDSRFYGKPKLLPLNPDEITNWFAAELLTLAEQLEGKKVKWFHPLSADIDMKSAHNAALDLAITLLQEVAK